MATEWIDEALSLSSLKAQARKSGAEVIDESLGRLAVYQIEAPSGFLWHPDGVSSFRVEWMRGPSGSAVWTQEKRHAIRGAINRMRNSELLPE